MSGEESDGSVAAKRNSPDRRKWEEEEEKDDDSETLENKLQEEQLHRLHGEFRRAEHVGRREADRLTEEEFVRALGRVMETDTYENEARRIFHDISIKENHERWLNWSTFLDHLISNSCCAQEKKSSSHPSLDDNYYVKLLTHNRRASTVKILSITASSFIYVFVSKNGVIGILDPNLKSQKTYLVDIDDLQRDFVNIRNGNRRICRAWVTDAQHMADCKKLVIGSTNRTIHFYDISAATHMEEFRVFGLPNVAVCFAYWFNEQDEDGISMLFFGDDVGNVHWLQFLQPKTMLFKKSNMEGLTRIFFMDLEGSKDYINYTILEKVHSQPIVRLQYVPHNTCLISCSNDPNEPLIIRDVYGKLKSYMFTIPKGIRCFDFHRSLNLLVTGGMDCLVRFWNPYVPAQPTSILEGHNVAIIDTKIMPDRYLAITYSRDMVLKTWDIVGHCCLQSTTLRFPVNRRLQADPEHGPFPLHLETFNQKSILVACQDYIAELKIAENKDTQDHILIWSETKCKSSKAALKVSSSECVTPCQAKNRDQTKTVQCFKDSSKLGIATPLADSFEHDALQEFGTYIFAKMKALGGHAGRTEMQHFVRQGLPFRALKVSEFEDVVVNQDLPMSDRMCKQELSYSSETDLVALNLNFVGSPTGLNGRSSRRSSVNSDQPTCSSRLQLPSIQSVSSSSCSSPKESKNNIAFNHNRKLSNKDNTQ